MLDKIRFDKFTAFEKLEVKFSTGINIFVGENGTGKTHILKAAYAACDIAKSKGGFAEKINNVFYPSGKQIGRLVKRSSVSSKGSLEVTRKLIDGKKITLRLSLSNHTTKPEKATVSGASKQWIETPMEAAYIPVKDMMANAPGFRSLYEEREIHFEEIYVDIIRPLRGEASASDRLFKLMVAAYGDAWSNDTTGLLLKQADHAGKTLETWLREKFFTQHCKLFQHRPFIWRIWDGLQDGFAALVNYHKLDYKKLETLIYTYLGDWISRQKQDIGRGIDGAEEKLAAAEILKKNLELILAGEAPYDIFVRWKPIEKQPIGWNPDLNDGVRLNIRPFLSVPDVGKRGAGILRDKPNIKWDKDRGKDVDSAPWYNIGPKYGGQKGDRINSHHLTLEEKRSACQPPKYGDI